MIVVLLVDHTIIKSQLFGPTLQLDEHLKLNDCII